MFGSMAPDEQGSVWTAGERRTSPASHVEGRWSEQGTSTPSKIEVPWTQPARFSSNSSKRHIWPRVVEEQENVAVLVALQT